VHESSTGQSGFFVHGMPPPLLLVLLLLLLPDVVPPPPPPTPPPLPLVDPVLELVADTPPSPPKPPVPSTNVGSVMPTIWLHAARARSTHPPVNPKRMPRKTTRS